MKQTIRRLAVVLPLLLLVSPLDAQIYRWVDDAGVVHYSKMPPPAAAEREIRELDAKGRERDVRPAPPTAEERERAAQAREQQRLEAERLEQERARQRAEATAREARVRQLHQTYASADDIREQRDRRLAMVENTLLLSQSQEATLQRERERIAAQVEGAKEGSSNLKQHQAQLADLDRRIAREQAFQERQRETMAEIEASAAADLEDYQRLVVPALP
jgi:hypothetical protein